MKSIQRTLSELVKYPSAIVGLLIIFFMIGVSIYALISIPYDEAIRLWRGGESVTYQFPKNVPPAWTNWFRQDKLPDTIILESKAGGAVKTVTPTEKAETINLKYTFEFPYNKFPQEMNLYLTSEFNEKPPFASVSWLTPDGRKIRVADFAVPATLTYRFSQDAKLQRRVGGMDPVLGLFMAPDSEPPVPVPGTYEMNIDVVTFEKGSDLDAELVVYGEVYGVAGTDHLRRDLSVAILWGMPIALSFGLVAALGTSITTMIIAAVGVWFGGWLDDLIQRITEINIVLPFLPILIMIGTFYSRSIWVILGATILLSIFGAGIKTYRANFMQIKESSYIEAAKAYGASSPRLIFSYLIPRIIPLLIPGLVIAIPTYVFLEASLAVLGLGDPVLPTWGKVIQDAQSNGALYQGLYYWVLEPAVLLMITGLAFAMVGFALDRIFNPRLRGI
jgi:peptide/nickel transport system permease protein